MCWCKCVGQPEIDPSGASRVLIPRTRRRVLDRQGEVGGEGFVVCATHRHADPKIGAIARVRHSYSVCPVFVECLCVRGELGRQYGTLRCLGSESQDGWRRV